MPYSGADDESLPKNVKDMSPDDREKWVAIFNKAFGACEAGGEGDCEAEAFKAANGALKGSTGRVAIRAVSQVDSWSGAASGYESTEAYCSACLIDLNSAAGQDEKSQAYCKLPVKAPGSSSYADKGIMAAAGALAGARGGLKKPDGVSEDAWKSALKKAANVIISAYKDMDKQAPDAVYELAGKEPPEKRGFIMDFGKFLSKLLGKSRVISLDQLYASSYDAIYTDHPQAMIHDLYFDGAQTYFIASEKCRIYRVPVTFPAGGSIEYGDWEQVEINFIPVSDGENRMRIIRQSDGKSRWVAISASSVLNRDGEIDSTALFDDMVSRAESTGEYPYRTIYHLGENFRVGQADMLARDGFLYISSGLFDDTELANAIVRDIEANPGKWGDSIGYVAAEAPEMWEVSPGVKIPVYRAGKNVEISCVLSEHACNFFTTTMLEVNRMNDQVKAALEGLLGKERAAAFIAQVDESNQKITDGGLITRSTDATADGGSPVAGQSTTPATSQSQQAPLDVDLGDEKTRIAIARAITETAEFAAQLRGGLNELVRDIVTRMEADSAAITALQAKANSLDTRVTELMERMGSVEQQATQTVLDASDLGRRNVRVRAATFRPSQTDGDTQVPTGNNGDAQVTTVLANLPKY